MSIDNRRNQKIEKSVYTYQEGAVDVYVARVTHEAEFIRKSDAEGFINHIEKQMPFHPGLADRRDEAMASKS